MFRLDGSAFCSDEAELCGPGCDGSKGQRSTGQGRGGFWAERIKVGLIKWEIKEGSGGRVKPEKERGRKTQDLRHPWKNEGRLSDHGWSAPGLQTQRVKEG